MTRQARRHENRIKRILYGSDNSLGARFLRTALTPLALLHQVGLELYLLPFALGIRKRCRLPCPVIAIGNLSSGGTGKTPMALLVAQYLQSQGKRVVLLSRGHGGMHEKGNVPQIVSDGTTIFLGPAEAGDEPVLLAGGLPDVPVIVGRDRRKSGRLALERFAPDILVCDDALQYWQLHRDLNIVLLDARMPFDNGFVLPRGLLREPPSHLSRAGIMVLTRADRVPAETLEQTKQMVQRYNPRAALFTASHAPQGWVTARDSTLLPLDFLHGKLCYVFSGIADGANFARTAIELGVRFAEDGQDFGDHHVYTPEDIRDLREEAPDDVDAFVTTEKDLVKVASLWPADAPPLYALRIAMTIADEPRFFQELLGRLPALTTPDF